MLKYPADIPSSLVTWQRDFSNYMTTASMSERPESPTLPMDGLVNEEEEGYYYTSPAPSTIRSTVSSSRWPSDSSNSPSQLIDYEIRSSPVLHLSSPVDMSQCHHIPYPSSSVSPSVSFQNYSSTQSAGISTTIANTNSVVSGNNSSGSKQRNKSYSHHHQQQSQSTHLYQTPPKTTATRNAAATTEIASSSIHAHHSPAPAAGMYWSRAITYGRAPSRPLRAHTANMIGEMMYVFGGCNQKTCFNQIYILDMDTLTWTKPHTFGQCPPPCRAHSSNVVEYMIGKKKTYFLYIFGGGDGPRYFNDLYVLNIDTMTWNKPRINGVPSSPRRAHTTCLWQDKIIIVGGGNGTQALSDVHVLDVSDPNRLVWSEMKTDGQPPLARGYHTGNLIKDKLVIYGGSDGHDCFSDVHVLNLATNSWSQVDLVQAVPRLSHTATQIGSYLFIIGGHDGFKYSNDVVLLNLVTMTCETKKIYGSPPAPRGYHTAVLHDSRLYVLGGYDGNHVFDDLYTLELSSCAYLPQITNFDIDA